jgi:amino-acid N-acetyltransferase
VTITISPACAADQAAIIALVRSERLNPNGLHVERFLVARDGPTMVGVVQMRLLSDGARELGSLVVAPSHRGRGVAGQMISTLLRMSPGETFLIARRDNIRHWTAFDFSQVSAFRSPATVRRHFLMGSLMSALFGLRHGRLPHRLVILRRTALYPASPIGASRVSPASTSAT